MLIQNKELIDSCLLYWLIHIFVNVYYYFLFKQHLSIYFSENHAVNLLTVKPYE